MTAMKIQLSPTRAASAALDGVVQLVSYRGGYIGACNVEDGHRPVLRRMGTRGFRAGAARLVEVESFARAKHN